MTSFFGNMKHKMLPVPADKQIETKQFLLAAAEILPFLDMLGATVFRPVKSDINGNINSLEIIYKKNPEKYVTLREMLEDEIANGNVKANNSAALSLLWLKRALDYLSKLVRNVAEDPSRKENMTEFVQAAYNDTLKRYHGWIVKQVFSAVAHAAPYRADLLKSCGVSESMSEEVVLKDMMDYSNVVSQNVVAIHELLVELGLNSEAKA